MRNQVSGGESEQIVAQLVVEELGAGGEGHRRVKNRGNEGNTAQGHSQPRNVRSLPNVLGLQVAFF